MGKEATVWHTWQNHSSYENTGDVTAGHLQRALQAPEVTLMSSRVPRKTSINPWCSLISVLLPAACRRPSLPSQQPSWLSQHSHPKASEDEACSGGSQDILHIASCSYCNNFLAYPCCSALSWGFFWKREDFQRKHRTLIMIVSLLLLNTRTMVCNHKSTEGKATSGQDPFLLKLCHWTSSAYLAEAV